jgi:predicted metal-dependent phosphoesterase TrpH
MRCDLHVHSLESGMFNAPLLNRLCRESYNSPVALYERLKRRGMSIVTITDHDSIEGAEVLRKHPDFFLSEEVTVRMPSGTEMHMGVYNITDRDHIELQRRRNDFASLLAYLTENEIFFSANHVFSGLTGKRTLDDFKRFASDIPAFETRNGQMWREANTSAERLAKHLNKVGIAGSDSHTIAGVGLTFTEVSAAQTVSEFFSALRHKRGSIHGAHGAYGKLTADVYLIIRGLVCEKPWTLPIIPIAALVPAFTAGHWFNEVRFCRKWSALLDIGENHRPMRWKIGANPEGNLAS